jgi:hypothetical protein
MIMQAGREPSITLAIWDWVLGHQSPFASSFGVHLFLYSKNDFKNI